MAATNIKQASSARLYLESIDPCVHRGTDGHLIRRDWCNARLALSIEDNGTSLRKDPCGSHNFLSVLSALE